jgi:D-alanine-D-alanine ligase
MSEIAFRAPLRVIVLAGGESAEREVSLRSGGAVVMALLAAGHCVSLVDPAESSLDDVDWETYDACFIALHGGAGEDGRIQRQLDARGVAYTGSNPEACRLAMSKMAAKRRFLERGVPTPEFVLIEANQSQAKIDAAVKPLGYPLVIKPDCQGSSIGVSLVESAEALPRAIEAARECDTRCLAEALVRGREFTVAVLDDRALPMLEIVSPEPLFSFEAKYASSLTEYRFEFELSPEVRERIVRAAVDAARALGTSGLARVDVMLGHDGRIGVLEVNTVPGLTPRSLAPQAASRAGLDMPALVDLLVRQCIAASADARSSRLVSGTR